MGFCILCTNLFPYFLAFNMTSVGENSLIPIVYVIVDLTKMKVKHDILTQAKIILIVYRNNLQNRFKGGKLCLKGCLIQLENSYIIIDYI